MSHPLEQIIRDAYAAFNRGDLDGYLQACTPTFTFNVPGKSQMSGTYAGKSGLTELAGKVMAFTNATFQEDVEDVLANDRHAVVLARHRFTRDGGMKDYRTAHIYEVSNGQLSRCFEQPRDPESFDEAWG